MQHFDPPPFLRALTCLQPLLEEGDLLTQRVDSVQLLQGVGQPADGVRADVLGLRRREVVEGGQHQLEFLRGRRGAVSMPSPARSGVGGAFGCVQRDTMLQEPLRGSAAVWSTAGILARSLPA